MISAAETEPPRRCGCDLRAVGAGSPDKAAPKCPVSSSAGAEAGGLGTQEPAVAEHKGPAGRGASSGRTELLCLRLGVPVSPPLAPSLPLCPH